MDDLKVKTPQVLIENSLFDEIDYEGEFLMAIDATNLNNADYCLECNDEVRVMEMI